MLSDFAPDKSKTTPGIILDAYGAIPTEAGFRPQPSPVVIGDALPGRPFGSFYAYYSDESSLLFAGVDVAGSVTFYRFDAGGHWTAVGGPFLHSAGTLIDFAQFGDVVIAVAGLTQGVVRYTTATPSFTAIAGSPASPICVSAVSAQVLTFVKTNWFSCSVGDETGWTALGLNNPATLAANGTLYDAPGPVVAAGIINRSVIAFKKSVVLIGNQAGPPFVWDFQIICTETGTWNRGCIIQMPDGLAFMGVDDFWITNGYTPERIPNSLRQWFFGTSTTNGILNGSYVANTLGWYDAPNATLYWHFVSVNAPDPPTCDMFVSYNTRSHRWCVGHQAVSSVPYLGIAARHLPLPTAANANIVFDGQFRPNRLSGAPGAMTLTTGYTGDPMRKWQMNGVKPLYNSAPASATLTPLHVSKLGDPDLETEVAALDVPTGFFTCGQYDNYHKWVHGTSGDCEVTGYVAEMRQGGLR